VALVVVVVMMVMLLFQFGMVCNLKYFSSEVEVWLGCGIDDDVVM
jgi:hypothetical protein